MTPDARQLFHELAASERITAALLRINRRHRQIHLHAMRQLVNGVDTAEVRAWVADECALIDVAMADVQRRQVRLLHDEAEGDR